MQVRFDGYEDLPKPNNLARATYPAKMLELINACLQLDPLERIPVDELWERIMEETEAGPGLRDIPMRFRGLGEDDVLRYKPDIYAAFAR